MSLAFSPKLPPPCSPIAACQWHLPDGRGEPTRLHPPASPDHPPDNVHRRHHHRFVFRIVAANQQLPVRPPLDSLYREPAVMPQQINSVLPEPRLGQVGEDQVRVL